MSLPITRNVNLVWVTYQTVSLVREARTMLVTTRPKFSLKSIGLASRLRDQIRHRGMSRSPETGSINSAIEQALKRRKKGTARHSLTIQVESSSALEKPPMQVVVQMCNQEAVEGLIAPNPRSQTGVECTPATWTFRSLAPCSGAKTTGMICDALMTVVKTTCVSSQQSRTNSACPRSRRQQMLRISHRSNSEKETNIARWNH